MQLGNPFQAKRLLSATWGALLLALAAYPAGGPPRILSDFPVHEPGDPYAYQSQPVAASNGSVFLVVWTESLDSNRIKAARVRASDGALLDPGGMAVAHFESYQALPRVASDGRDFLIVWEDIRGATGSDIQGAWVTGADGQVPQVQVVSLLEAEGEQMFPAVASSGDGFLVAWEDVSASRSEIRAARMGPGVAAQPPLGFLVEGGAFGKFRPGVASSGASYLVAWEDARSGESDLYARRVDAAGMSALDEDAIRVSGAASGQINLAIASNGADYLVAWEDYRAGLSADIYAARVRGADGAVLDPSGVALSTAGNWQIFPTVASSGGDYLVAWEDYAAAGGGMTDLIGSRFGSDGALMETGLSFAGAAGSQFLPSLAAVAGRYLLAWQDMTADGLFRIRGQFAEFDEDRDRDGITNRSDNCPDTPNPGQEDADGDGMGDACDPDDDNDAVLDAGDDCPLSHDPGQEDADGDGLGDACDADDDNDGAADAADNCPLAPNPDQADLDQDGTGNLCDTDDDGDGVADAGDNCPLSGNASQGDLDGDGLGDACDPSLEIAIDVAPGDPQNLLPMGLGQTVQVAVMGTARFGVSLVAPATVRFAGAMPRSIDHQEPYLLRDVNSDGRMDMVFRFRNDELDLTRLDVEATLSGLLKSGMPFSGKDAVKVQR